MEQSYQSVCMWNSLNLFNDNVRSVRSYSSISIDWHVPHDGDVVVFIVRQSLAGVGNICLSSQYHDLYRCSNGDMLQHYCAWRCTLFWLIPHIQIQYGPLSLHVANTFCICSPLAGHILFSGSFWCLLPGLELRQVVPLFLLSDYMTTTCVQLLLLSYC